MILKSATGRPIVIHVTKLDVIDYVYTDHLDEYCRLPVVFRVQAVPVCMYSKVAHQACWWSKRVQYTRITVVLRLYVDQNTKYYYRSLTMAMLRRTRVEPVGSFPFTPVATPNSTNIVTHTAKIRHILLAHILPKTLHLDCSCQFMRCSRLVRSASYIFD